MTAQMECGKSFSLQNDCYSFNFYENETFYVCELLDDNFCTRKWRLALQANPGGLVWDKLNASSTKSCIEQRLGGISTVNYCETVSPGCNVVKDLTIQCVGGHELKQQRQKIQALADETNQQLKKNVYQNYMQFIETAKEISFLESEMYQLSHMLAEQRTLLTSLLENSVVDEKVPSKDVLVSLKPHPRTSQDDGRKKLVELLERVENCANVVENPFRTLLHEGDMVELDPTENTAIQRVKGYLLNDSFMLATWIPNRRGPIRLQFQEHYELDGLAVVNIRDLGPIKHAFKLLMFPDTRVFQCANAVSKKEWIDMFDKAKKDKAQAEKSSDVIKPAKEAGREDSESNNPFGEDDDLPPYVLAKEDKNAPDELPEWVLEVSDDLDVCIAQRDVEEAVALLEKSKHFWDSATPVVRTVHKDLNVKIEGKARGLTEVLLSELKVSPDRCVPGGPRAARKALALLVKLGKSTEACELFLRQRSAVLKHQTRQLKTEGATGLYVTRMASLFFPFIAETGREVLRAFPDNSTCISAFIVWARQEVHKFCSNFRKHVFTPQTTLSTIAECMAFVRLQCKELSGLGLDIEFALWTELGQWCERSLKEGRDKLLEAIKLRALEEKWRPLTLPSRQAVLRLQEDLEAVGVASLHTYVYNDVTVSLTSSSIQFSKSFLAFLEDGLRLCGPEAQLLLESALADVTRAQLRALLQALASSKYVNEKPFIHKNVSFIMNTVLALAEQRCQETWGFQSSALQQLRLEVSKSTKSQDEDKTGVTTRVTNATFL
nr:EOG090X021B [Lepidurus arcticus]